MGNEGLSLFIEYILKVISVKWLDIFKRALSCDFIRVNKVSTEKSITKKHKKIHHTFLTYVIHFTFIIRCNHQSNYLSRI